MRAGLATDSATDHLRLAQWCIKQQLFDAAAQELAAATALDPSNPMIDMLRRRSEVAQQPALRQSRAAKPSAVRNNSEGLDRMVRSLPPAVVEGFSQRVQPILMNDCTAGGCHGNRTESSFGLLRIPTDGSASRRLTRRNLQAALQWINRDDPAASRLLTAPLEPHGTAKTPVFADPRPRLISDWRNGSTRLPIKTARRHQRRRRPSRRRPPAMPRLRRIRPEIPNRGNGRSPRPPPKPGRRRPQCRRPGLPPPLSCLPIRSIRRRSTGSSWGRNGSDRSRAI